MVGVSIRRNNTDMECFPFYIVHQTTHRYPCFPYPTFAEVLAKLDQLQPNFGWGEKFTCPLEWLCGNRSLDTIRLDSPHLVPPEALCIIFHLPPTWVWRFYKEALCALEHARAHVVQLHRESLSDCPKCNRVLKVCDPIDCFLTNSHLYRMDLTQLSFS